RHDGRVARNRLEFVERGDDFFNVIGAEVVLRASWLKLAVGIDKQNRPNALRRFLLLRTRDDDASRDSRVVEELRRQADDGFDVIVINKLATNLAFLATAKQDAVRHDGGHTATVRE